jgi:hypothetical protein
VNLRSFLLLTCLVTPLAAQDEVASFDLALRRPDLVCLGRVVTDAGRSRVAVEEVWRGTPPAQGVWLADTSRLALHVEPSRDGRRWFLVLAATPHGFVPTQWPGVVRPCEGAAEAQALRRLVTALGDLVQPTRSVAELLAAHVRLATVELRAHPDLAASTLLALARRGDLLPRLAAAERGALQALLEDATAGTGQREMAVTCLHGAGDPSLVGRASTLLRSGRAHGLGPIFGRLIAHQLGARSTAFLAGLAEDAAPAAAADIAATQAAASAVLPR